MMAVAAPTGLEHLGEAAPQSGEVTGVIRPPPDIRAIVDKTAQFVAQHGKSFESRILSSDAGKSQKFSFMKATDPYHAYYELKIRECEENGGQLPQQQEQAQPVAEEKEEVVSAEATTVVQKKASATAPIARVLQGVDTSEPPPKLLPSSSSLPATGLSPVESEIVKLTAQYTAASGRQFLAGLAQREQRNPQFDFLKPTHVLFSYFTSLVDAYTKVLAPSRDLAAELELCTSEEYCLRRCARRWDWTRREEDAKRREKAQQDAERVAFQAVDWHDFVVVDTIDFPQDGRQEGDLSSPPPPQQTQKENEEQPPGFVPPSPRLHEDDPQIKIVSEYSPRVATASERQGPRAMIDPLTGNEVPIDRMSEHMRIQLLDPKWREEQKKLASSNLADGGNATLAAGDQIVHSLTAFAKQRNDIFGSTEDEQAALLDESRLANNKPDDEHGRIIWDGHGSSINKVHAKVLDSLNSDNPGTAAPTIPGYQPPLLGAPPGMAAHVDARPPPPPPTSQDASFQSTPSYKATPQLHQPPAIPFSYLPSVASPPLPPPPPPPPSFTAILQQAPSATSASSAPAPPPPSPPPQMAAMAYPPPPPPQQQQQQHSLQPQQQAYFQVAGAAASAAESGVVLPPPPPPVGLRPDGEPEAKRPRVDPETGLVSEADFVQLVGDAPQTISIKTPVDDSNSSWGLKGQTVTVECKVTDTIREVKQQLSSHLGKMPPNKQQLRSPTLGFLKDTLSLAHFNIKSGDTVELKVRRR